MTTQRHPIKLRRTSRITTADCQVCSWGITLKHAPAKVTKLKAKHHTQTTGHIVTISCYTYHSTKPINTTPPGDLQQP